MLLKFSDKFEIVEDAGDKGALVGGRGGNGKEECAEAVETGVACPYKIGCVGGVDGKSGPLRRLKVNGVCTAGRCRNLEDGEPICAENILELAAI